MENAIQNIAQASEAIGSQSYPAKPAKQVAKDAFEAMLTMLGARGHSDTVQLFAGRVPYHTVVDWRRGRATIPRWAFGYLATLCQERANVFLSGAAMGKNAPAMPAGRGSHNNIAAWNARRAALLPKKKEARG